MAFKKSNNNNFSTSKNNPYEQTDYTLEEKLNQSILDRNADNSRDTETIKFKKHKKVFSHVLWVDDCDIQSGGQGYDAIRHQAAVDLVMKPFNVIYGIGGDLHDNANKNSATDVFGNRINPSESIVAMQLMFKKHKNKISFVIGGNHDDFWGSRLSSTNLSMTKHTADLLESDYIPFAMIYSINLLTPEKLEPKTVNILVQHNAKGNKFSVTDNSIKQVLTMLENKYDMQIHIIQTEHMHTGSEGTYDISLPHYSKDGKRVADKNHQIYVANGSTWQTSNTVYGAVSGFSNKTNVKALDISWAPNPYYTKEKSNQEEKYILCVNAFNVLKDNSTEPSLAMKKYLKIYSTYSIESFKEKFKNKSLVAVANELENAQSKFETEMKKFEKLQKEKNQKIFNEKYNKAQIAKNKKLLEIEEIKKQEMREKIEQELLNDNDQGREA